MKKTRNASCLSEKSCKESVCKNCKDVFLYYPKTEKGDYCSWFCRREAHSVIIKKTYTPKLRNKKRRLALEQMKDPNQIKVRQEKCGYAVSEDQKNVLSKARTKTGWTTYRQRALDNLPHICVRCAADITGQGRKIHVHHKDESNYHFGNHELENLEILCSSCHAKYHNEIKRLRGTFFGETNIKRGVSYLLQGLGFDSRDPNVKDTPARVARSLAETLEGLTRAHEIPEIFSSKFPSDYEGMVAQKDISVFGMCPHHLLPVEYKVDIGVIYRDKMLGLSKLARVIELLGKRPVLQETFTHDIVKTITKNLKPLGMGVVVKGRHYCMITRGVKQDVTTNTSAVTGVFKTEAVVRAEWFSLLK